MGRNEADVLGQYSHMDRKMYQLMYEEHRRQEQTRYRHFCQERTRYFCQEAGANRHFCQEQTRYRYLCQRMLLGRFCYSYTMAVDKGMYYVYTMGVVMIMYHKEVFHVEVYCEDMYCEGVYYVKYVGVLDYYKVYCEVDYYRVDNWVQEVEILVFLRVKFILFGFL